MSSPLIRRHKSLSVILAACCLGLPLIQGCEGDADTGDREVREHLSEGAGKTEAGVTAAPSVPEGYKKAAAVTSASPATKVEALTRLADAERDRAVALLLEADRLDVELHRLVGAINRQAARIQSNNTLAVGLSKLEPKAQQQAIQAQRSAAQGEQNPVWIEHETGAITGLKGLQEQTAQLQEQIGQLEEQSKGLATQRSKMIADAEQLEKQSEQAQGQQSAELYDQSVDSRKQAADLGVQIEALEAKLSPLRQDLDRTQANQQAIAKTVETFGGQLRATQESWQKVQAQIAELQNLNKRILGSGEEAASAAAPAQPQPEAGTASRPPGAGSPPLAASIGGKLRQANDLVAQIESRRTEAEALLKSAVEHAKGVAAAAASLSSEVGERLNNSANAQRPERKAWQQLQELHAPSRFKLKEAMLDIILAGLHRSRAADLALRSNMVQVLTAALQPAQLTVPQEAGGKDLAAEAETARQASLALYGEADTLLKEVVESSAGSGDLARDAARAGHLMQLVRLYSQAQVDPQTAQGLAANARSIAAQGEQVQLPPDSLPAFLQDALELRSAATTGPATRPAAAPAGGAATPTPQAQ